MIVSNDNGQNRGPARGALAYEAELSLRRLQPRLDAEWERSQTPAETIARFESRLAKYWPTLFTLLYTLYGQRYDFFYHLEQILLTAARGWADRPRTLRELDAHRINEPEWFQSERLVGGALYVDLFSENLGKLRAQIPYFQKLGLTYLHLMPLFAVRPGDSDGGYAISNYRSVDPRIGTIDDLRALADDLREAGIVLVLDFVFNHTADDHHWAQDAQAGLREFQDYYYLFPDRTLPDRYEQTLRDIFPTVRRGSFTWHEGMQRWIWTTFNSFQWDLNYGNPAVFRAMLDELLFIANTGVDIVRLDAVAFIWKRMGTSCENQPEAHTLIRAFNALARIAAPGLLFKSEAIVHPDEVVRYVDTEECQVSYNPTLMALLWESLATRKVSLLTRSLSHRHQLPPGTTWINYLRCHDDIGWTFDDQDAEAIGINAYDHRKFLNAFYTGQFPGSFARGVPFQHNAETGDMRISGTMASLAGLEQAIEANDAELKERAIRRMLLLYAVTLSIGGIPLLYLGEEWGMLNDYDFVSDPAKAGDTRWVHRPKMRWEYLDELQDDGSIRKRIFTSAQRMIQLRKELPALADLQMELVATDNPHVLGYVRMHEGNRLLVLANFSEEPQTVAGNRLRTAGLGRFFQDRISGTTIATSTDIELDTYGFLWLERV
jgi:amylosucrase